jgi:hypothetical protein
MTDHSSVTIDCPRLRESPGNRIWLSLPRNPAAQERLAVFGGRSRFQFEGADSASRCIVWTSRDGKRQVRVQSPLRKYLRKQRANGLDAWRPEYGDIHARDLAVIARFHWKDTRLSWHSTFYDYFIAGIRGLGTWGAGWYITHRYADLARLVHEQADENGEGDVQALLLVTFDNYCIQDVIDVSDKDQGFFDRELEDSHIDSVIADRSQRV